MSSIMGIWPLQHGLAPTALRSPAASAAKARRRPGWPQWPDKQRSRRASSGLRKYHEVLGSSF